MKATINDVAKYAGVSIKTVSRVTNKEPTVKQATVDKVNEAIRELNYQPNAAARNLASTTSYVIGFVYDNPNAYYIIEMQNGILAACRDKGYELLIHPCDAKSKNICNELIELVKHSRLAGLVLTPPLSEDPQIQAVLDEIDARYVRIVAGDESRHNQGLTVLVDDRRGACAITNHLIDLGHSRIAFISGDEEHESTKERFTGFADALNKAGIVLPSQYVVEGNYSFESGVQGANRLLAQSPRPTAIVACNDEIAAGALFAARLANVDVPGEVSIVGFEDSPFSRQTWPKLTTVHQPNETIASVATELLISNCKSPAESNTRLFTPEPVIRDSSRAPTSDAVPRV